MSTDLVIEVVCGRIPPELWAELPAQTRRHLLTYRPGTHLALCLFPGGYRVCPDDAELVRQLELADEGRALYSNTLSALASA